MVAAGGCGGWSLVVMVVVGGGNLDPAQDVRSLVELRIFFWAKGDVMAGEVAPELWAGLFGDWLAWLPWPPLEPSR